MSIAINWSNIRTIDSSQQTGFEEFVCQLAKKENIPNKKQFIRNGTPDAGIECYWLLNNDEEIGWQAKYFLNSFTGTQWTEIKDSVLTALDKHPNLKKYILSVPYNPPDSRNRGEKTFLTKWNEKVKKWKSDELQKTGRTIEIEAWWASDLISRLNNPNCSGFINFWFDKTFLTEEWFKDQNTRAITNLGPRYSTELNVDVPINNCLEWISQSELFYSEVNTYLEKIQKWLSFVPSMTANVKLAPFITDIKKYDQILNDDYQVFIKKNDLSQLESDTTKLSDLSKKIYRIAYQDTEDRDHDIKGKISPVFEEADELVKYLNGTPGRLFRNPYLMITGDKGTGKSHLLANIVTVRITKKLPSILILGQQIRTLEVPEQQILHNLDLQCTFSELLVALNCIGEQIHNRVLLIIDAINEGAGKEIWQNELAGFIQQFIKYENVGLIISLRSSYKPLFKEDCNAISDLLSIMNHPGFADVSSTAITEFFSFYNMNLPTIPLLNPEFNNPLFLKLFCETNKDTEISCEKIEAINISTIFKDYVDKLNNHLSNTFNYSGLGNAVQDFLHQFIIVSLQNHYNYLEVDEIRAVNKKIVGEYNISGNFVTALESEGILLKDVIWTKTEKYKEVYFIAYERLSDYYQAAALIENDTVTTLQERFSEKGDLYIYLDNMFSGLLETWSIIIPQNVQKELFELIPESRKTLVFPAYLESLKWRSDNICTSKEIQSYLYNQFNKSAYRQSFFESIFLLAPNSKCYFNALWLNDFLYPFSLSERDYIWSITVCETVKSNYYDERSSYERIIDWAWSTEIKDTVNPNYIFLSCIALSWLLTVPNRRIRDTSTKALICLLTNRLDILLQLLRKFENVNDPYVSERLFAVAFGCAVRSENGNKLKELAEYTYNTVFNKTEVYPDILLRDYAKNLIQFCLYKKIKISINISKIIPPYKSESIEKLPSNEEIDNKYKTDYNSPNYDQACNNILQSMTTEYGRGMCQYGDFGRYVFENKVYNWKDYNANLLSNLCIKWIFEKYGYTSLLFSKYDNSIGSGRSRPTGKEQERVGKKYQWIAMHELLARLSDNAAFYPNYWGNKEKENYIGTFEPYVRDIDPTMINKIIKPVSIDLPEITVKIESTESDWYKDISEIPQNMKLIQDSSNQNYCLFKHNIYKNKKGKREREIWLWIQSYFVKKETVEQIFTYLSNNHIAKNQILEPPTYYQIFSREYYWSDAYKYFTHNNVTKIMEAGNQEYEVIPSSIEYLWESEFDCSKEEAIHIVKPTQFIVKKLNLHQRQNESYFYNNSDNLVLFDIGENQKNENGLFINKQILDSFLAKSDYTILWTLSGEKNIIGKFFPHISFLPEYSQVAYWNDGEIVYSPFKIKNRMPG